MPELFRVHAAQQNILHCIMNNGYNTKKGGLGTVNIMTMAQVMLKAHASISRKHRQGFDFQSSRIQLIVLKKMLFMHSL